MNTNFKIILNEYHELLKWYEGIKNNYKAPELKKHSYTNVSSKLKFEKIIQEFQEVL